MLAMLIYALLLMNAPFYAIWPEEVVFQKVLVCLLVALGSFPTVDSIDMRKQFHFSSSSQIDSELISHQCSESHSKM